MEDKKIINLLSAESEKINPDISAFSLMLENLEKADVTKEKPVRYSVVSEFINNSRQIISLSQFREYFIFEKKALIFAGTLAMIAFVLIMPQLKTKTDIAYAEDLVASLVDNSTYENDDIFISGENIELTSFDDETDTDLSNLEI